MSVPQFCPKKHYNQKIKTRPSQIVCMILIENTTENYLLPAHRPLLCFKKIRTTTNTVATKTANHLKPSKTTWNYPQPLETICNHPPKTIHHQLACPQPAQSYTNHLQIGILKNFARFTEKHICAGTSIQKGKLTIFKQNPYIVNFKMT